MSLKNKTVGYLLLLVTYISSCANQTSPTGGPKDEDPPVLEQSVPEDKSLNYHRQTITLSFDEYIKLNNPKEEIIITPRLLGEYQIKHKKNKVTIEIEDTLFSNTTYTINFREAIQDINESNSPTNLQLAFSTGDYLDSLTISGKVHYLLSNDPGKNITVSLYDASDTLDVVNSPPVYFTKSNSSGEFTFNNLKNGKYNIYAINDKNKNLTLESKSESYGYFDSSLQLDSNITDLNLPLINLNITPLLLQSSRARGHYYVVKYNKYVSLYTLHSLLSDQQIPKTSFSEDHREIKYYNTGTISDSLGVVITAYDTISNPQVDTVYVKFEESKREKDDFKTTYTKVSINKDQPELYTEITFTKPVFTFNLDSIYFKVDSTQQIAIDTTDFTWNIQHTILTITKVLDKSLFEKPEPVPNLADTIVNHTKDKVINKPSGNIKESNNISPLNNPPRKTNDPMFYFGTAAFQSVEQDSSVLHTEKVSFTSPASTGTILINIETDKKQYYIQLINNKGLVVSEKNSESSFSYEAINPGTYKIRVLVDLNENNKWDIGDITKNLLPEPVLFYTSEENTTEITLRANWELGPLLIKF